MENKYQEIQDKIKLIQKDMIEALDYEKGHPNRTIRTWELFLVTERLCLQLELLSMDTRAAANLAQPGIQGRRYLD